MARALLILCLTLAACAARPSTSQPAAQAASNAAASPPSTIAKDLPLVVIVRADWCPTCRRIEPTVTALQREYAGRVSFLVLDVTDDAASARSTVAAEQAGVGAFFRGNDATGIVAVFSRGRSQVALLAGEGDLARYREPLSAALSASR